jgi:hypothetical protein
MAGTKPFFLTGANAKIQVNGVTLAFATNVSYSVTINHATPTVLGMYEPSSVEPLSYAVSGSFSVIRYVADITSDIKDKDPAGVSRRGNGVGSFGKESISEKLKEAFNIKKPDGRAYDNLNPGSLNKGTTFNIEIYQKTGKGDQRSVARIRDARITKADFSLSSKSAATQSFSFTALYVDEDTFLADFSGNGQQFA